jgi:cytochrome P450
MTMSAVGSAPHSFRPPAPEERTKPLTPLGMAYTLWRNPLQIWSRAHFDRTFVAAETALGPRFAIMDPQAIKHVMLDNVANYRKDELQLNLLRPGLGQGLLTVQGEEWRRQRRATAPMFSPRQILEFAPAIHKVSRRAVERLAATPVGKPVPMHFEMALTTLQVLEQTLFSQGLGENAAGFYHALTRYFDTIGRLDPLDLLKVPKFVPRLARLRGRGVLTYFGGVVDEMIASRRRLIESGAEPPSDLLTLLLRAADPETGQRMSEADVRSNIITFIGAGHETTGNVLTWTLYLLSQSPEWRQRLEAEVDAAFDPDSDADPSQNLPITRAVAEEAMRLYPPAALMTREAIGEDWVCGQRIQAGTVVLVSPYVVHRHRQLWKSPELYDPSRFLGENREKIDRFAFIPFGAGPRVCIGMTFAYLELATIIAHLVKRFRFELAPGCVVTPQLRVTLRPRNGLQMIVHRRG